LFIDEKGYLFTYTASGNYTRSTSYIDIVAEWQDPHPLEGTPVGTWVMVWDNQSGLLSHRRLCYRFLDIRDGKVVVASSDATIEHTFDNGRRLTSNEI